jgi:type IV secretory pathway VirB2 component (pilin)
MKYDTSNYLINNDSSEYNIQLIYNSLLLLSIAFFIIFSADFAFAATTATITTDFTATFCVIVKMTQGPVMTIAAFGAIFFIGYKTIQGEMKIWAAVPMIAGIIMIKLSQKIVTLITGTELNCV